MDILKIAIQKSSRISKNFIDLLLKCGFRIQDNEMKLYLKINELPIELYFVRGIDIPYLLENNFEVAILGRDSFLEYNLENISYIAREFNFAKCRLSFIAKDNTLDLNNKSIATSYPNILNKYLKDNNINAKIIEMNGSVESAIQLNIANVVFDIIETGSTIMEYGLTELFSVMNLKANMIVKKNTNSAILDKLLFRMNAVLNATDIKYIMFNIKKTILDDILNILPAGKSPTILDLLDREYCAIHTLCHEEKIWDLCEILNNLGADSILVSDVTLKF